MVSALVLTAAPVEAVPWPVLADRIDRRVARRVGGDLRRGRGAVAVPVTVPATALVACVPLTAPPEVLT